MQNFMENLRSVVRSSGRSSTSIANHCGLSKSTVSDIMSGANISPQLETVMRILEYCGGNLVIVTEQSRHAIDEQDVSWYREELNRRDAHIDELLGEIQMRDDRIQHLLQNVQRLENKVDTKDERIGALLDRLLGADR